MSSPSAPLPQCINMHPHVFFDCRSKPRYNNPLSPREIKGIGNTHSSQLLSANHLIGTVAHLGYCWTDVYTGELFNADETPLFHGAGISFPRVHFACWTFSTNFKC